MQPISTTNSAFNTTSPKTISVAVAAGDVLVVKASTEDAGSTVATPTNNGAALTWTLAQSITTLDYATAYVWTATADTARTIIVTLTRAGSAYIFGGSVEVWRDVTVGASAKATASGAPSVAVTTTAASSALSVVSADWNSVDGSSRTWRTTAGAVVENLYAYPAGGGPWYGATHADVGAVGSKTVGLSAPTGQKYSIIVVELAELAPSGGAWSIDRHTYGRNSIAYSGNGSGTISVSRTTTFTDGTVETVTVSGAGALNAAVPTVLIDGDVPFGVKVTSITYTCAAVTITVPVEARSRAVISDPHTGLSVSVRANRLGPQTWKAQTSISYARGWADPLFAGDEEYAPAEDLTFTTTSRSAELRLRQLASPRRALLVRFPEQGTEDGWFVLDGDRPVERQVVASSQPQRRHTWTLNRMSRQRATEPQTAENLGAIDATYATLGALDAAHPTLGSLARAILTAEEQAL